MDQTAGNETARLTVPMVDPEIVKHLRALRALGWGSKRIARELGIARNSVRRYLRDGVAAETQTRPGAWTLDARRARRRQWSRRTALARRAARRRAAADVAARACTASPGQARCRARDGAVRDRARAPD